MLESMPAAPALLLAGCVLAAAAAQAQPFPSKPIRIIVPTSPGGLNDLLSRNLGQAVSAAVGQPVIVENRPGAGSMIGMSALARSPADGYTVGITTFEPLIYNPLLYHRLPYDAEKDFSFIAQLVRTLGVIIAHAAAPGASFPEMIAYARANPGRLNWATWGPGSPPAVYLDWIKRQNGVEIAAIPYKGAGPSLPAIVSGEVQLTYTGLSLAMAHIKSGKLKALAVTTPRMISYLPGVPTLGSFNSDADIGSNFSLYGPAGVPMPVQERLAAEFGKALSTPALAKVLEGSMEIVASTPAEFALATRQARENAVRVYRALGIKPTDAPN